MQKVIDTILNEFDFETVYSVMKLTDGHWKDFGIPCIERQKETARELLEMAAELIIGQSANIGGFVATRIGENELELSFVLTQTSASN